MTLIVSPQVQDADLSRILEGSDQDGEPIDVAIAEERPITLYVNKRRVVTLMSLGDHIELLALGYLYNQCLIENFDDIDDIQYDPETDSVAVSLNIKPKWDDVLRVPTVTSGCGQGVTYGDVSDIIMTNASLSKRPYKKIWLSSLLRSINTTPSLYLVTGAIHGCVLCFEDRPLVFLEDIGRHNALDKLAGYMVRHRIDGGDKALFTTGRLTSEMVTKCVRMNIPVLISRSGFTAMGVELARKAGLTLIGRAKGRRYQVLSGAERLDHDGARQ